MATQGPLSPGTLADDSARGTVAWSNPGNAAASDNSRATATLIGATSHYLKATNFGFSIPSGATIDGIVVEVERSKSGAINSLTDDRVRIVKGGTVGTTDKADTGTSWPGSSADAYKTYGSSSDLWGETWTHTDINASNFGMVISAVSASGDTAQIDHIRITVHYTSTTNVTGVAATATAQGHAPAIVVATNIVTPTATATALAPAPALQIATNPTAPAATATAMAPVPIVGSFLIVSSVVATATAEGIAPTLLLGTSVNIAAPPATAVAGSAEPAFESFYTYQTPQETEAHMSASLRQATPSTPDPQTLFVRVDGSVGAEVKALLGVEHGIEAGNGTEVIHADLILTLAEAMPAGTYIFTVKAIDEAWDASTVTWDTAPSIRVISGADSFSALAAGDEVTIDITDLLGESVSLEGTTGQQWFGLEMTVDGSDEVVFYGASSIQYRPRIVKEVSRPPVTPFNLRPTSGLHVSELKPMFAWDFRDLDAEDTLTQIHFQLDTTDDFETPSYDSGEVASTTSFFDSNSPPTGSAAFSNLTNTNSYYWRVRHADSHGLWSEWSDPQLFTVTTKGTLTADPTPTVPTPTISWSLSVTQQAYYVLIERYENGTWLTHWEQPWTTGTTSEVTLPGTYVLQAGTDYRRTIRVTDTVDRASVAGDLAYYEDVEEFSVAALAAVP